MLSMLQVIGYEGAGYGPRVCYGTAAISDGVTVYNPITGARMPFSGWADLVERGCVREIEPSGSLFPSVLTHKCMVLRSPIEGATADILRRAINVPLMCLTEWLGEASGSHYYLFPNFEDLNTFAVSVAFEMRQYAEKHKDKEVAKNARTLDRWEGKGREQWLRDFEASLP